MVDKVIKEMIEKGAIDESEAPFDEDENQFEEEKEEEKIELPHTIELKDPFEFDDKKYTEITFKNRLDTEMIMHLHVNGEEMKHGHYIPIISKMTGELSTVIKKLAPVDLVECEMVVSHFFYRPDLI